MAKILGKAGRYTTEEAAHHRNNILLVGILIVAIAGLMEGMTLSSFWARLHPPAWLNAAVQIAGLTGFLVFYRWGSRKMDEWDVSAKRWERGAEGETQVAKILTKLPDEYHVIHDLSTPGGNLDHVVVGPTGVFVLDAKNWRGLVTADGKGELTLNGKPTRKREIGSFVSRVMTVREKVKMLAAGRDVYFQAVFVFTAASVDAKWGTTGRAHCITDNQLLEYIQEKSFGTRLDPAEVRKLAQAFLGLAHMDQDFTDKAESQVEAKPVLAGAS